MNKFKTVVYLSLACFVLSCGKSSTNNNNTGSGGGTGAVTVFANPLLSSGPDPWVTQQGSNYYFTYTTGNNLRVYQTAKMSQLSQATPRTVWQPPATGAYSGDIWAPEIHYLQNKWYLYFAADNGNDTTHRIFVLETSDPTPSTNNWTLKGQLKPTTDKWAIDPTILEYNNNLYLLWSGWKGYNQPGNQQIYIAKMKDPYTIDGDRVMISEPTYAWEENGSPVNEGPEILTNSSGNVFLIYSASSCFTDDYCLGMLSLKTGGDPMNPADWTKAANPVFTKNTSGNAFGPGHCAFFVSKDTKESWIVYHANSVSGQGCGDTRSPRMQKFTWNTDGTPNFGTPVPTGNLTVPSGE
jgi:GH43 family beta-xylosidase